MSSWRKYTVVSLVVCILDLSMADVAMARERSSRKSEDGNSTKETCIPCRPFLGTLQIQAPVRQGGVRVAGSVVIWGGGPGLAPAWPSRPALRERRPYGRIGTLPVASRN